MVIGGVGGTRRRLPLPSARGTPFDTRALRKRTRTRTTRVRTRADGHSRPDTRGNEHMDLYEHTAAPPDPDSHTRNVRAPLSAHLADTSIPGTYVRAPRHRHTHYTCADVPTSPDTRAHQTCKDIRSATRLSTDTETGHVESRKCVRTYMPTRTNSDTRALAHVRGGHSTLRRRNRPREAGPPNAPRPRRLRAGAPWYVRHVHPGAPAQDSWYFLTTPRLGRRQWGRPESGPKSQCRGGPRGRGTSPDDPTGVAVGRLGEETLRVLKFQCPTGDDPRGG